MALVSSIDLSFRPASYWDESDSILKILAKFKGLEARRDALELMSDGKLDELERLLGEPLDAVQRAAIGKVQAHLDPDDYLPDYLAPYVVLAQVSLASLHGDWINVEARRLADGIAYSIAESNGIEIACDPEKSEDPLSLEELIDLMDGCDLGMEHSGLVQAHLVEVDSPEHADFGFVSVSSDYYPGLETWYERVIERFYFEDQLTAGGDYSGRDLSGVRASRSDLEGACFYRACLAGADLFAARLCHADLRCADLRYAILQGADLEGARLEGADLRKANLRFASLRNAALCGADLRDADLHHADMRGADFSGAKLDGCACAPSVADGLGKPGRPRV